MIKWKQNECILLLCLNGIQFYAISTYTPMNIYWPTFWYLSDKAFKNFVTPWNTCFFLTIVHPLQSLNATQGRGLLNRNGGNEYIEREQELYMMRLCRIDNGLIFDLKRLRLSWSGKYPLNQFRNVTVLGKKLSGWNLLLANGIWREWGWIDSVTWHLGIFCEVLNWWNKGI